MSWLIATGRPEVVVELGPGDEGSLASTFRAAFQSDPGMTCAAVLLPSRSVTAIEEFQGLTRRLNARLGPAFVGYETEQAALAGLGDGTVGLLHLSLFDSDDVGLLDLVAWQAVLAPGAVVVVTTTASNASSNFAKVKDDITGTYPAVSISLGLTTEAVVAQRADKEGTPIVDLLRKAPFAVGAFLALLGDQLELHDVLTHDLESSETTRALIGRVIDQQHAERSSLLSTSQIYKDEAARLSIELVRARDEVTQQMEAARREREHLVEQFLDRMDELSAKLSTTASRYSAELADLNALLEAEGRKVEDYAALAANAESLIVDMQRSTSWRITAPVRLVSRMLARKAPSPTHLKD